MLTRQAPAKVNLGLNVCGPRADGYHDIATIFLKISLVDTLHFAETSSGMTLICDHPDVPSDAQNLICRAVALLQPLAPDRGVQVHLQKRIPVAAGLGGGSSDAAATLLGLNTLWDLHLSLPQLADYASCLGADVPFFLLPDVAAVGRGRGDELEPLTCAPEFFLVLPGRMAS